MSQAVRMNNSGNAWEADPWDATDAVADYQLAGFEQRALLPIVWTKTYELRQNDTKLFGMDTKWFSELDVEFCAVHNGEDFVLMQLLWHGFPDPPEWRLASRVSSKHDQPWETWGYFANLPVSWEFSKATNAPNN